jgi:MFS family permease
MSDDSVVTVPRRGGSAAGIILPTLAAAQFLMTLDTSVMNVSIATVADDVGTTITGIQTAITLYTLVMASLMITGGKIGEIIGRKRAFAIGCVIYGVGSFTTAIAPTLGVLIIGWSFLEGVGAILILPAIVALIASNFAQTERPRAYGLVASAGAIAVAVGPLIGGLVTTYTSWRWVFAGEVLIVIGILALARRMDDATPDRRPRLDVVGTVLSAAGLGLIVYGVLRSGVWGWVEPKPEGPEWLSLSPVIWLILGGALIVHMFFWWERRRIRAGEDPLLNPNIFEHVQMRAGLRLFSIQYMVQAGLFFTIPLFLSVALGLSAVATGARLLPISATLLLAAAGIPRFFPHASPRRIIEIGLGSLFAGIVVLIAGLDVGAGPEITTVPLLLAGLGIGALASQLGAVTVSAVPETETSQVGGIQNTATNLGASIGTALAGAILIGSLTSAFLHGISQNPAVPEEVTKAANVQLSAGAPFISDADLRAALDKANVPEATADAIVDENEKARLAALRSALAILAVAALAGFFFTRRVPKEPPRRASSDLP